MKRIAYILLFMFFISCHTKKAVAEKVSTQTSELATVGLGLSAWQHSLLSYQLSTCRKTCHAVLWTNEQV